MRRIGINVVPCRVCREMFIFGIMLTDFITHYDFFSFSMMASETYYESTRQLMNNMRLRPNAFFFLSSLIPDSSYRNKNDHNTYAPCELNYYANTFPRYLQFCVRTHRPQLIWSRETLFFVLFSFAEALILCWMFSSCSVIGVKYFFSSTSIGCLALQHIIQGSERIFNAKHNTVDRLSIVRRSDPYVKFRKRRQPLKNIFFRVK